MLVACVKCEVGEVMTFTVVRVLARHRVLDVSLGPQHSCVLVEPGHIYTLGSNSDAQLGSGSTRPQVAPISVKLFHQRHAVVSVILCYHHLATVALYFDLYLDCLLFEVKCNVLICLLYKPQYLQ